MLDLQSGRTNTRKEGRGAPFEGNVEMYVWTGWRIDVPTTKVSQVLQSVSKWLYDKDIDICELPSTATANNFVDSVQILGKYQLAEKLVESDSWDLHGDGKGESGCSGAPFRDNIQKCIIQLVGELDIPTTKVSQVL